MDEQTIANKLTENIPQEAPEGPTVAPQPETGPSAFESNIALNDPAISLAVADYLDVSKVDRFSDEKQAQMREIFRWASETSQSTDIGDVLLQIRMLENELGTLFKPDRLSRLSRWVSLHRQAESLRKQMEMI